MSFDPTKPVQTRNGRAVRILCVDAAGFLPIIALVLSTATQGEILMRANKDGVTFTAQHGMEERLIEEWHLVNPKVKKWRWAWTDVGTDLSFVTRKHFTETEMKVYMSQSPNQRVIIGRVQETEIEV